MPLSCAPAAPSDHVSRPLQFYRRLEDAGEEITEEYLWGRLQPLLHYLPDDQVAKVWAFELAAPACVRRLQQPAGELTQPQHHTTWNGSFSTSKHFNGVPSPAGPRGAVAGV